MLGAIEDRIDTRSCCECDDHNWKNEYCDGIKQNQPSQHDIAMSDHEEGAADSKCLSVMYIRVYIYRYIFIYAYIHIHVYMYT